MVYAISRKTNEQESKYHSSKLELLAIKWALERLRALLISLTFTIVTDCQFLVNLNIWETQNAQMARWISEISEYKFEIKHMGGDEMAHALSRAPIDENLNEVKPEDQILFIETREEEILLFQRNDPDIKIIIDIIKKPEKKEVAKKKKNHTILFYVRGFCLKR